MARKRRSQPRRDDRHTGNSSTYRWAHRVKEPPLEPDPVPHRKRSAKGWRRFGIAHDWGFKSGPTFMWYLTERQRDQAFDAITRAHFEDCKWRPRLSKQSFAKVTRP